MVAFPATTKRMKKEAISAPDSDSPSMLVLTRAEVRSSVGVTRRTSASSDMSVVSCWQASISVTSGSASPGMYSGSLAPTTPLPDPAMTLET